MATFINLFVLTLFWFINCEDKEIKKAVPFSEFRRQVEELPEETTDKTKHDLNIVSYFVENVKELLGTDDETSFENNNKSIETTPVVAITPSGNYSVVPSMQKLIYLENFNQNSTDTYKTPGENIIKDELLNLSKNIIFLEKAEEEEKRNDLGSVNNIMFSATTEEFTFLAKRSCVKCDNVMTEDCTDPANKLIPSVLCDRDEDLCYSQHTPFGIVDRGCYNIFRNISTYVCSCNLCNYLAISEMPHIFSTLGDWKQNVIDMSRTKRFRHSIFKQMSCLRCEVNVTTKTDDILDSANCLEGSIGTLPIQECNEKEICGIKAVRNEGYVWRGCISKPLYNYWWAICDTDLCNHDKLISLYDI